MGKEGKRRVMPALFDYEMALAAVDPWKLREDGSSNWSVHYFDRMGRWTASATGMNKADAKKKAAKGRRMARREIAKSTLPSMNTTKVQRKAVAECRRFGRIQ